MVKLSIDGNSRSWIESVKCAVDDPASSARLRNARLWRFPCGSLLSHFAHGELSERVLDDNVCSL